MKKKEDHKQRRLSKFVSLVLRHRPDLLNLGLDPFGFVDLDELVKGIQEKFPGITRPEIEEMVKLCPRQRFQIQDDKIRARYGHSVNVLIDAVPCEPPEILYHGTSPENLAQIQMQGLKPMGRRYVHLSKTKEEAVQVGRRRSTDPIILRILAKKAHGQKTRFFDMGNVVLVEYVSPDFIEFE